MRTLFLALALIVLGVGGAAAAAPCPAGVAFPAFNLNQSVAGVPVNFPATATVGSVVSGVATVCVLVDLSDLQQKISAIIDTFHMPTDNCADYSSSNLVVSLPTRQLSYGNGAAVLSLAGSVTDWLCAKNPIPNSEIVWEIKKIGPFKTKVPVLVTWPAPPIKTVLAVQPFNASLPFHLVKIDPQTLELQPGVPSINLQGQYAFITNGVLFIAGININAVAYNALRHSISGSQLDLKLPPALEYHIPNSSLCLKFSNPAIVSAQLIDPGPFEAMINVTGNITGPGSC
jgi:hypothetical protein